MIFSGGAVLLFFLTSFNSLPSVRYLFMALLIFVAATRLLVMLSRILCSPELSALRLLPVNDAGAGRLHTIIRFLSFYTMAALSFLALIKEVGIKEESFVLLGLTLGTVLLPIHGRCAYFSNRRAIQNYILAGDLDSESNWLIQQFAAFWHVLAICYLLVVWMFFVYRELSGSEVIRIVVLMRRSCRSSRKRRNTWWSG